MIVRSEEKNVLDAGSIPAWSTRSILRFTDKEDWSAVFNWLVQYTSDGPVMVSTGQRVPKPTIRQATDVISAK